jgi:hypothetical protein
MIDDAMRPLLRNNRHSQEYRVLKIIQYIIETAEDWDLTDSETTVYRRVASIMNHLFRFTGIKLADGETASDCTKEHASSTKSSTTAARKTRCMEEKLTSC